eukprot:1547455-Lingulodinium_polyedra.AAC.1
MFGKRQEAVTNGSSALSSAKRCNSGLSQSDSASGWRQRFPGEACGLDLLCNDRWAGREEAVARDVVRDGEDEA